MNCRFKNAVWYFANYDQLDLMSYSHEPHSDHAARFEILSTTAASGPRARPTVLASKQEPPWRHWYQPMARGARTLSGIGSLKDKHLCHGYTRVPWLPQS